MPKLDGAGPMGQGPRTGRGLGPCGGGMRRGWGCWSGHGFRRFISPKNERLPWKMKNRCLRKN